MNFRLLHRRTDKPGVVPHIQRVAYSISRSTRMKLIATAFAVLALLLPAVLASQNVSPQRETPVTPVSIRNILFAQPFTLETPYTSTWSKEKTPVSSGVLIVVEVDPAYVVTLDATLTPVLYAGNSVVERLNHGYPSGRVIGIVPGSIDLNSAPIWFGSPELPERVTRSMIQAERARAQSAGVRALPSARISSVQRSSVAARDLASLLRDVAAQLVYEYSPEEKQRADSWRLPEATASPTRPN